MLAIDRPHTREISGISLYTLLAAIVVLGVLASVLVTQFTGTDTRATAMLAQAQSIARAAERFHLDTGCRPMSVSSLFDYQASRAHCSCNRQISQTHWHGPYMKELPMRSDLGGRVHEFGSAARVAVDRHYGRLAVRYEGATPEISEKAFELCGGASNDACGLVSIDNPSTFVYYY